MRLTITLGGCSDRWTGTLPSTLRAIDVLIAIHSMGRRSITPAPAAVLPVTGQRFLGPTELVAKRPRDVLLATPNLPMVPDIAATIPHSSSDTGDIALVLQRIRTFGYRPVPSNPRDSTSEIVVVRDDMQAVGSRNRSRRLFGRAPTGRHRGRSMSTTIIAQASTAE